MNFGVHVAFTAVLTESHYRTVRLLLLFNSWMNYRGIQRSSHEVGKPGFDPRKSDSGAHALI